MLRCPHCGGPNADHFTPDGMPICGPCSERLGAQLGRPGARKPDPDSLANASTHTLVQYGLGLMAGSVALGVMERTVLGHVHFLALGILFVAGLGLLVRGSLA